jgi:hypothetical protein
LLHLIQFSVATEFLKHNVVKVFEGLFKHEKCGSLRGVSGLGFSGSVLIKRANETKSRMAQNSGEPPVKIRLNQRQNGHGIRQQWCRA